MPPPEVQEDVLRQVPTVDVDIDGNITLRGDANVTILIDGKKVGFDRRTMVDNLQASMIKKLKLLLIHQPNTTLTELVEL